MSVPTIDQVLQETAIGCGLHMWHSEGGYIDVRTDTLKAALEDAYDPMMPDWQALVTL